MRYKLSKSLENYQRQILTWREKFGYKHFMKKTFKTGIFWFRFKNILIEADLKQNKVLCCKKLALLQFYLFFANKLF